MLTCYDATFAHVASTAGVDMLLIGDTLGMILQGHDSTLPVTVDDMVYHTDCVRKGNTGSFIIADMPFMSSISPEQTLCNAGKLMRAGAQMVKREGGEWLADVIRQLTRQGVPVCAHIGLTPHPLTFSVGLRFRGEARSRLMICSLQPKNWKTQERP